MILRVTEYDEPVLRCKGERVKRFDANLKQLTQDMLETMYAKKGIGLAAQQVGQRQMVCVVDLLEAARELNLEFRWDNRFLPIDLIMPLIMINPTISFQSENKSPYEEGCLSFPGIHGLIYRSESIEVDYLDLEGSSHRLECNNLLARVIQHETDHLNGILFIDRMGIDTLEEIKDDLKAMKKNTRARLRSLAKCLGTEKPDCER